MIFNDNNSRNYLKTKTSKAAKEIIFPLIKKLPPSNKLVPLKFCNSKGKEKLETVFLVFTRHQDFSPLNSLLIQITSLLEKSFNAPVLNSILLVYAIIKFL